MMAASASSFLSITFKDPFSYPDAVRYTETTCNFIYFTSLFYVTSIFSIQYLMRNREAFDLRRLVQGWNLFLAVFSLSGAFITGSALFKIVRNKGFIDSYCRINDFWHGTSGLWTFFFCFSKVMELGDTYLIVLRKRPLIFLHWYHHVITMNYGVLTYVDGTAYNTWIVWLNFAVHSVMYSYYFVVACKVRVSPQIARVVTCLQILQFVVTFVVLFHVGYLYLTGYPCVLTKTSYIYCFLMEASFVYLFGRFFHNSYIASGKQNKFKKA